MKKVILFLLSAVIMLVGMTSCDALNKADKTTDLKFFEAVDEKDGTCLVKLNSDNIADLVTEITFPAEYNGMKVIGVADGGFRGVEKIKKVFIPEGYEKIGANAFNGCSNLQIVELGANKKKADSASESGEEITAEMTVGHSAFANCVSLTTVEFGKSVTEIGAYAFKNTRVVRAEFSAVRAIGDFAFADCTALTYVYIPSAMTVSGVGKNIFSGCKLDLKLEINETAKANGVTDELFAA